MLRIDAIVVLVGLFSASTLAQQAPAELTGQVVDQAGGVLADATVEATNEQTSRIFNSHTDTRGRYHIALTPGAYRVRFTAAGFAPGQASTVTLTSGTISTLDAVLSLGTRFENVRVTARPCCVAGLHPPALQIDAPRLDAIPKGRTFQSVAGLAPSVNVGEVEGGIQAGGASGAENSFTIDGVETGSVLNGASRQNVAFELVDEVQIATAGIPAKFSGRLGGVVAVTTKSG